MASSWTEICNIGLVALGSRPIANIDEDTENGRTCKAVYRQVIDEVTSEHNWYCARARQTLSYLSTPPEGNLWAYQYQLPVSPRFIRMVGVDPDSAYELEGNRLLSNEDEITLIYTSQIIDPALISPKLAYAMGMRIADILSMRIVQSNPKAQWDAQLYRVAVLEAKQADTRKSTHREEDVEGTEERTRIDEVG
jgi:hypothetical protein